MSNKERPDFTTIQSVREFNTWYWLKTEIVDICKSLRLPTTGNKFDLDLNENEFV